jgi:hypothetical protein
MGERKAYPSDLLQGNDGADALFCDGFVTTNPGNADIGDGGPGVDSAPLHDCEPPLISIP